MINNNQDAKEQIQQKLTAIKLLVSLILSAIVLSFIILLVSINQQKKAIDEFFEQDLIKIGTAYKYKDVEYIKYKINQSKPDLEDIKDYMMINTLSGKDLKVEPNSLIFKINKKRCLIIKRKMGAVKADFFINGNKVSNQYECNDKLKGEGKIVFK